MVSIPLYFQVTANASVTAAGTRLVPAVIGNPVGGLLTGYAIRGYVMSAPNVPLRIC
jgi:hypothetical protein